MYTQQLHLNIAITAMVNQTALQSQPNASVDAQDDWTTTQEEVQARVSLMRHGALSLTHKNLT